MHFPQLRKAFDHDAADLAEFSTVLQRELLLAAAGLDQALQQQDPEKAADINHKLKTSLRLLDALPLREALTGAVAALRAGDRITGPAHDSLVPRLRDLAEAVRTERW